MSFVSNTRSVRPPNRLAAPLDRHAGEHDDHPAYALACVIAIGSVAMFACPLLPGLLHLDRLGFDLWSGASIQEIAQTVAASFQNRQKAGELATLARIPRGVLLAPMAIALRAWASRHDRARTRYEAEII